MGVVNFRYKYIIAFICLLTTFLCGYNFKQWYITRNRLNKHISVIYSFAKNDVGYGKFEEYIIQEFRKQGVEPVIERFYLDCEKYNEIEEIARMKGYLETIKSKPIDLILPVGDQSTYALLTTHHPLLNSIPVVACNVNFPNEKLISEYDSRKVYVLRDRPDFKRNIEFIRSLQPHSNMKIIYNVDFTALGRESFDLLTRVIDRKNVQIQTSQSVFAVEGQYEKLQEMIQYYTLTSAVASEIVGKDEWTVSLCPFRYIKGTPLLVMMERSKCEQSGKAFLLDKFDLVALPIVHAMNIPSFSCIREGFGEDSKIVGGYMATDEISARSVAELSVRLMNREKIGMPKIRDLEKEYVLDWKYFSSYSGYDLKNVSRDVRLINYPFYDRYRKELYFLFVLFILTFIVGAIILMRIFRRSRIERKNMTMLEEAHKRLTLSADGGQISLWNMQGEDIEFDDNYIRLTGLNQRNFTRSDFQKYTYPDDLPLLSTFYEKLQQSPGVQVQRIRFSFDGVRQQYQWYELRCRSLKDAKGEMMLAGIMHNIQETVDRERQLIIAKQMAEKAELKQSFLNNMSHEIRTPLNAIVGFTNLLVGEGSEDIDMEEKANMLEIINHNNELLLKLIEDVVEISRFDSGNIDFDIREWDVVEIVNDIYKTYQSLIKPDLHFHLLLDDAFPLFVNIDRIRFIQVISNFLNNANKFTQSGSITLGCKVDDVHGEVRVYVEDTGKGIDEEEVMMIFDRFYKTDEFGQGSGLGLPICKVIVERLSGRIEVHSELGKGSCFTVVLSLADM